MNESESRETCPSCRWFGAALFWMLIAALLGVLKTWDLWKGALDIDQAGTVPFGRAFLANKAVFIYGWAVPALIGVCLTAFPPSDAKGRDWNKVLWGIWQLLVACGAVSVLLGQGSGVPSLSAAWWICPVMALALGGMTVLIVGGGWAKRGPLSCLSLVPVAVSLVMMVVGMFLAWWTRGAGMPGVLAVSMLDGMLPLNAVVIVLALLLKESSAGKSMLMKAGLVLLAVAGIAFCPFAGWASLVSWPVPACLADWGRVASSVARVILIIACLLGAYGLVVSKAGDGGSKALRYTGFFMVAFWLAWRWIGPDPAEEQFSISAWYAMEPALFGAVGLIGGALLFDRLARCLVLEKYVWLAACLFPIAVFLTAQYAAVAVGGEGVVKAAELNSGWLVLISFVECASWAFLGFAAILLVIGMRRAGCVAGANFPSSEAWSWRGVLLFGVFAALAAGSLLWSFAAIDGAGREVVPFVSLRPGVVSAGSAVYASEGCGLCHTQIVRRSLSGGDVQQLIHYGRQGDVPYRVSEPQDYEPGMEEGVAQIGFARIGPDLFNLAARVGHYVTYRDADGGERRVAAEREWLLLHLYHPKEPLFGKLWTTCPPMTFLFEKRSLAGARRSPDALPVTCGEGYEIVPSPRAVQLVDYLLTLKRTSAPETVFDEAAAARRPWSHVPGAYAARPPVVDFSPVEREKTAGVMQRGRQIFLARCSVCHGENGMGDQVNYPPLDGSEWLTEKRPEELVSVIRYGLKGPITVKGKKWDSIMLPPGVMAQKELAPLMTYLLRTFGKREIEPVGREQAEDLWNSAVSQ